MIHRYIHKSIFWIFLAGLFLPILPVQAITFYPLVYTTKYEDESTEWSALGPFLAGGRSKTDSWWSVRPFVSRHKDPETGTTTMYLPPPFGSSKSVPENEDETGRFTKKKRFLLIIQWLEWTDFDGAERTDFWIFPLWYSGKSDDGGSYKVLFPFFWYSKGLTQAVPFPSIEEQNYFAIFPLFGTFHNFFLRDKLFFFLFPLYVYDQDKNMRGYSVLWPIFGINRGDKYNSWRAWPLVGHTKYANGRNKWYFLWPLIHWVTKPKDPATLLTDDISAQIFLPFFVRINSSKLKGWAMPLVYGRFDSPTKSTRGYIPPLLSYGHHKKLNYKEINFLWFIGKYRWGDYKEVRLWPLFAVRSNPKSHGWYFLWPFVQYKFDKFEDYSRSLFMIVPFYYVKKWNYEDESQGVVRLFWPFYKYERLPDGSKKFNILWMFWYREWDALDQTLAPLWTIYKSETDTKRQVKEWSFLKPLLWGRKTPDQKVSEFNLLGFQYRNQDGEKRLGFLFRKFSFKLPF